MAHRSDDGAPPPAMLLEVIVMDAREARVAAQAGADRLELVAALDRGGLTPDLGMVADVCAGVPIPVNVMLRPHDRDFVYATDESRDFPATARSLADAGATAIVFGALDRDGDIDVDLVAGVASASRLPLTFHRAFDASRDPFAAYAALRTIPAVTRVLTSGHAPDVEHGCDLLRELTRRRVAPIVLAGGGVTRANVTEIVRATGVCEVHVGSAARTNGAIDGAKIRDLIALLRALERGPLRGVPAQT